MNLFSLGEALSPTQATTLSILIVISILSVNILNGLMMRAKINKNQINITKQLEELSKQLLIQSGYLKDKDNE